MWLPIFIVILLFNNPVGAHDENDDDPCKVCKAIVSNFEDGLDDTESMNFDGGSSSWEHERKIKFAKSETRLTPIMEKICDGITRKDICLEIIDKHEDLIAEYFFNSTEDNSSSEDLSENLEKLLCIQTEKVCCPEHHYGPNCEPCKNVTDDFIVCNNHGTCDGDGTRSGTGDCVCSRGFTGDACLECSSNSYQNGTECHPCHASCNGTCVNGTVEGCLGTCATGWIVGKNGTCEDINECATKDSGCKANQYCINVPGKHYCENCHASCQTCNGHGESNCLKCNPGYGNLTDGKCEEINECEDGTHECKPGKYCVNIPGGYKCKKCDKVCKKTCSGPGPEKCDECDEGYIKSEEKGCIDVDECENYPGRCPDGKYCMNKVGSYKCKKCDEACNLCHGPGPYSCLSCSEDYELVDGVCIHVSKKKKSKKEEL